MRSLPLGLAVLFSLGVVGCSTETAGLLEDDYGDSAIDWDALNDDASAEVEGDATEDSLTDSTSDAKDSTVVDSGGDAKSDVVAVLDGADVAIDSSIPDVLATDAADSGSALDTGTAPTDTGTAPTDTGTAPTDTGTAPTDTGTAPTDTGTAPADTGGGLTLTPNTGKLACGTTTCDARPDWCCGRVQWDLSIEWTCAANNCIAARDFICDEKADCASGDKCCAIYPFGSTEIQGSECKADCGSRVQLCMTNAECASPKTCVPRKVPDGPHTIGVCQ